jgi:hypothetical protein
MNEAFIKAKLEAIEEALKPHLGIMCQAADAILDQDISSYPIFVVHQAIADIGFALLRKSEDGPKWSVNASTLEELATKQIVEMSKVNDFRKVYKDPRAHLCLFVLSDLGANFLFMPRPADAQT